MKGHITIWVLLMVWFCPQIAVAESSVESLEARCKSGDNKSCNILGVMLTEGNKVPQDSEKARALFEKGCQQNNVMSCYNLGLLLFNGNGIAPDKARAAQLLEGVCQSGMPDGCMQFGEILLDNQTPQDDRRAFELFTKACAKQDAQACGYLGIMYGLGQGVFQDEMAAGQYLERACSAGHWEYCTRLGKWHIKQKQAVEASKVYLLACQHEKWEACQLLGTLYAEHPDIPRDMDRAVSLFQQACNGGFGKGCFYLALFSDKVKVIASLKKACALGDTVGCNALSLLVKLGKEKKTVPVEEEAKDTATAMGGTGEIEWPCKDGAACWKSGNQALDNKEYQQAIERFDRSCLLGDIRGCSDLGALLAMNEDVPKDFPRAQLLFETACQRGHSLACFNLGLLFQRGWGVPKDETIAQMLYERACEDGMVRACKQLFGAKAAD